MAAKKKTKTKTRRRRTGAAPARRRRSTRRRTGGVVKDLQSDAIMLLPLFVLRYLTDSAKKLSFFPWPDLVVPALFYLLNRKSELISGARTVSFVQLGNELYDKIMPMLTGTTTTTTGRGKLTTSEINNMIQQSNLKRGRGASRVSGALPSGSNATFAVGGAMPSGSLVANDYKIE